MTVSLERPQIMDWIFGQLKRPIHLLIAVLFMHILVVMLYVVTHKDQPLQPIGILARTELMILSALLVLFTSLYIARWMQKSSAMALLAQQRLAELADFAADLYWETDPDGYVISAGGRLMPMITSDVQSIIGQHYQEFIHLEEGEKERMRTALKAQQPYSDVQSTFHNGADQQYVISLSATPRFNKAGVVIGYLGVGTDVSERVQSQRELQHMAEHDMLTGLANRYLFSSRIAAELEVCTEREGIALISIDLDGFKLVNDKYGHDAGDALLNLVAKRLRNRIRTSDWAARLGGDEFVVVSRQIADRAEAHLVASRLIEILAMPYRIGGLELQVKASIGVACAPGDASTVDKLMKCADLALYRAKSEGKGCFRLFDASAAPRIEASRLIESGAN